MRDTPIPIIAYVMVGITSAVLAYVTYYDNSVPGQENNSIESNIPQNAGFLTGVAAMLPALPTYSDKKEENPNEEPPLVEAKVEENIEKEEPYEATDENREPLPQAQQVGGKKSKKNKTKNHKHVKKDKNNKTKHRK